MRFMDERYLTRSETAYDRYRSIVDLPDWPAQPRVALITEFIRDAMGDNV